MDPVVHPSQSTLTPVSSTRRRGSRENETPAQRQKREKAAERQRRKRERDRHVNNLNAAMSYPQPTDTPSPSQPQQSQSPPEAFTGQELTPEELARRERVRAAARERQRKHRSLVKQRKMRELGIDMASEMIPGMEDVGHNDFSQGMPHEMPPHPHPMNPQEPPPFPQPPLTGGQNFAATVLLAFSWVPFLKQHILRTLSMTSEELASLEPIMAEAFDQWDHQRRMHFAQQQAAAKVADGSMAGPSAPSPFPDMSDPSTNGFGEQPPPHPSEFRARFHRSLVAPSPFRNLNPADSTSVTTSTPGSGPPSDPIDPHLTGVVLGAEGDARQKTGVEIAGDGEGMVG